MDGCSSYADFQKLPPELQLAIIEASVVATPLNRGEFRERAAVLLRYSLVNKQWSHWSQSLLFAHPFLGVRQASEWLHAAAAFAHPHAGSFELRHARLVRSLRLTFFKEETEEEEKKESEYVPMIFLPALVLGCSNLTELKLGATDVVDLFNIIGFGPGIEKIFISNAALAWHITPSDFDKSRLRQLYLSEVTIGPADQPSRPRQQFMRELALLPALTTFSFTYPLADIGGLARDAQANTLSFLSPVVPRLTGLSTTTHVLERWFADTPLLFFDCFADLLTPRNIDFLPRQLKALRLNAVPGGLDDMPEELMAALKAADLPALAELWVPKEFEEEADDFEELRRWCKDKRVEMHLESFGLFYEEMLDHETSVFDFPFHAIAARFERRLEGY